jgi:enamine deaminase RidA (YjgF/YER057c/UK114 family)
VQLLAYGTLAGGWLTDRWLGAPEPEWEQLSTWSLMKYARFLRIAGGWSTLQRVLQAAASVAARHRVSIANVASRFILDQPGVAGVIIGARLGEREHIDDTLRLFSLTLTDEDRAEIGAALATLHPIPGDCGDEYRKPPFLTASGDLSHHLDVLPPPYQTVPREGGRTLCLSGTSWEGVAGFARAVRQGRHVFVSGTTATMGDRVIGGNDPAAQAHFVIDKIEGALQSLGATLADVVRTRVYVRQIADWEAVARAHGARFAAIQPANTLVGAALVGDQYLVEIEAEAEVGGAGA